MKIRTTKLRKQSKKPEYYRGEYLKYEWLVLRNNREGLNHLCGYVKLWKGHPLEKILDTEGYDGVNVNCHGGITFGEKITTKDKVFKKYGFTSGYWIGWDYAHLGDFMAFVPTLGGKDWTVEEVIEECYNVIEQLTNKYL